MENLKLGITEQGDPSIDFSWVEKLETVEGAIIITKLDNAEELRKMGVKDDHIVIRIDPIIPTEKGLITAKKVFLKAYKRGFRRFRVSLLDCYSHVRERFEQKGLKLPHGDSFYPSLKMIENANRLFTE